MLRTFFPVFLALGLLGSHALAGSVDPLACFSAIGGVSPNADLVSDTYLQLLTELGKGMESKTLQRVLESENPFHFPDEPGADRGSLREKMALFEKMLREKEWLTPAAMNRLRETLGQHIREIERAAVETEIARENTGGLTGIPIYRGGFQISPDGKWALSDDRPSQPKSDTNWKYEVYDLQAGTKQEFLVKNGVLGAPRFSTDGSRLLFPAYGSGMYAVSFQALREGNPDWLGALVGQFPVFSESVRSQYLYTGKSPDRVIAGTELDALYLFDLGKRTRVPVDLKRVLWKDERLLEVGIVPGSDALFLKTHSYGDFKRVRLTTYSVDAEGKLQRLNHVALWDPQKHVSDAEGQPESIHWLSDGRPVYESSWNNYYRSLWMGPKKAKPISFQDKTTGELMNMRELKVRPRSSEGLVLADPEYRGMVSRPRWAVWVNLETMKVVGSFELPVGVFQVRFSPDGKTLYGYRSRFGSNETDLVTIDFEKRLKR